MAKKYVLAGINTYAAPYALTGPVNDINEWERILKAKGYNGIKLLNGQATYSGIINALTNMVKLAVSGDSIVFAFSGHGTRLIDRNNDEADGYDEALCPVNFNTRCVLDDDLRLVFDKLKTGVTLDVFLDSCYSGTATRGEIPSPDMPQMPDRGVVKRGIPDMMAPEGHPLPSRDKIPPIGEVEGPVVRTIVSVSGINHALFSASADNQTSLEMTFSKMGARGVFTYALQYGMEHGPANITRQELSDYANWCFNYWNQNFGAGILQTSQLECTSTEAAQPLFT